MTFNQPSWYFLSLGLIKKSHKVPLCTCYGTFEQNVLFSLKMFLLCFCFWACETQQCYCIFVMPVTFTCLLFSFGELCQVSDGPLTSCLRPAVFQLPPLHWLDISCASLPGQQTALWLWAAYLKWPTARITVSFSGTIYKPPVPFYCLPSLQPPSWGFPSGPFPHPPTVLLCVSLAFQ